MTDQTKTTGPLWKKIAAWNWTRWMIVVGAVFLAFHLGERHGADSEPQASSGRTSASEGTEAKTTWTCSMHPQIQLPEPGSCPICGMDLIPLEDSNDDAGPRALAMSDSDKALAEIQTTRVERRFVEAEVRLVGKVTYDETKVKEVSAWVPGRLDRLFVDYTGTAVSEGDHMVLLYSPKLLEAQGSLIEAAKSLAETADESSKFLRDSARRHLESEREKLRLWGLSDEQIREIEERGTVQPRIQINSPLSGVVIHKKAVEGMYVDTGTPIYTVADLSEVWLELDAYEMDFSWIRYGQTVEFSTEAYPGETFAGWISFIPPYLDESTRTKKIRVNVRNEDLRLKPGMFVRALVRSKIAAGGRVMAPDLAGKFICPMHHEVVEDGPGRCKVCGMDLVTAESLGFVTASTPKEAPMVVPTSAVLLTGRRGVVYVALPDRDRPTYEGREVVVGPRAGDWYVISAGLEEGDEVVTHGNFKIDSALQILAKPSMMSLRGDPTEETHRVSSEFLRALAPLFEAYLRAQVALSKDEFEKARSDLVALSGAARKIEVKLGSKAAEEAWATMQNRLTRATEHAAHARDIEALRAQFLKASEVVIEIETAFGHAGETTLRLGHCPMADGNKGASWLQTAEIVENPYFGASMYRCGEIRSEHEPRVIPDGDEKTGAAEPVRSSLPEFRKRAAPVYERYFEAHRALAGDDQEGGRRALESLGSTLEALDASPAQHEKLWREIRSAIIEKTGHAGHAQDMTALRVLFGEIATEVIRFEEAFGHAGGAQHRVAHCPMAHEGRGGTWLQLAENVENPFFGASMYRCGEIKKTFEGDQAR